MKLPTYSNVKPTRVIGLAQMPSHWDERRMKFIVRERSQKGYPDEPLLAATQNKGVVRKEDYGSRTVTASKDLHLLKLVKQGDFVISLRSFQGGIEISHAQGIISPAYTILIPASQGVAGYLRHYLKCSTFIASLQLFITGIREGQNIDYVKLSRAFLPVPPPEEQAAIVRYLYWACGRLDRAIRAKRKVIALLNEQKQGIIHGIVTGGPTPEQARKATGSRWFPSLPSQWHVLTLGRVISAAIDGPHFSPQYQSSGVPFISARNIKADRWELGDAKYISEHDYEVFCRRVRPEIGDVLYTKGGTTGVARAVDLDFPFQVWVHVAVLKLKCKLIDPEFLSYCLNSPRCYEQSQLFTRGATNQDLGLGRMKQIELPVPPSLKEQKELVSRLTKETMAFSKAVGRIEQEMTLMREYRTRLIADVVTGKVDVREAASRLPVEELVAEEAVVDDESMEDEEVEAEA